MTNLLPLVEKKNIKQEYRMRVYIVSLLFLSVLIIIAIVSLLPLYISSLSKLNDIRSQMEVEKQKASYAAEEQDPIKITREVNAKLAILGKKDSALPQSSNLITTIVGYKPDNIKINAIFYDRGLAEGKILLNGIAEDRETLLSFLKLLEGEKIFTKVDLPISSFVKEKDIEFSIKITTKVENKKDNETQ